MSYKLSLDEISIFINGGAWTEDVYVDDGYKVVRVTNMINGSVESKNDSFLEKSTYNKYIKHKLITKDLVIATVGSHPTQEGSVVGRTSIVPKEYEGALLNQNAVCIRIIDCKVNQFFFNYLTKTRLFKYHIESRAQGSANQVRMALSELKKFTFTYPIIEIQDNIVKLISKYDNLIENNNTRIKLLENMAEELYKEWFVRLRFPNYQNTKIVDGIPDGWEEKNLFDTSDVLYGSPLKSSLFNEDKLGEPIVRIRDIKNNTTNTFTTERIKDEKYYLRNGDFIVGMDGDFHVGKWSGGKAILNQRVVCFRTDDFISKYFFYFSVKKEIDYLDSVISGTTVAHLSDRDLKKINILIPSKKIMNSFKILVDNLYELEIDLKVKNQNLKETRDLLLPRLISCKLDIKDMDIV